MARECGTDDHRHEAESECPCPETSGCPSLVPSVLEKRTGWRPSPDTGTEREKPVTVMGKIPTVQWCAPGTDAGEGMAENPDGMVNNASISLGQILKLVRFGNLCEKISFHLVDMVRTETEAAPEECQGCLAATFPPAGPELYKKSEKSASSRGGPSSRKSRITAGKRPEGVPAVIRDHPALKTLPRCHSRAPGDGRSALFRGTATGLPSRAVYSPASGKSWCRRGLSRTSKLGDTDR